MTEVINFARKVEWERKTVKSNVPDVNCQDQPFAFSEERKDCKVYIKEKTARLKHLINGNEQQTVP